MLVSLFLCWEYIKICGFKPFIILYEQPIQKAYKYCWYLVTLEEMIRYLDCMAFDPKKDILSQHFPAIGYKMVGRIYNSNIVIYTFEYYTTSWSLNDRLKLVWFDFMVYQLLLINAKSCFSYILNIWFVNTFCRSNSSISNNSIKYQSFVYIQLNDQTVPFLIIQFSINHLFALSLNVKQFYLVHR